MIKIPALCLFAATTAFGATLSVQVSVSGPLSGGLMSYSDSQTISRSYTFLATGGTGAGYVVPFLSAQASVMFCSFHGCSTESGGGFASSALNGGGAAIAGFDDRTPVYSAPHIDFLFGVPETWQISLSASASAGSVYGTYPENPVVALASFEFPTVCFGNISNANNGQIPCTLSFNDASVATVPEPATWALAAAALGAFAMAGRRAERS